MINLIGQLGNLGFTMDFELQTDLILQSLPSSFDQFVTNYHMNKLEHTLPELMNEIVSFHKRVSKGKGKETVLAAVSYGKTFKKKGKKSFGVRPKGGISKKNEKGKGKCAANSQANDKCYHCKKLRHWKRNCPLYMESLRQSKAQGTLSCHVIETELNVISYSYSWIIDSAATSHICMSLQDLHSKQLLEEGAVTLKMANGAIVAATCSGTCRIVLSSSHVIVLYKTMYFDTANKNILSVNQLCKQGYTFMFDGCKCCIYLRNKLVGTGLNINGLYVLETNEINMTNTINKKRSRNELNSKLVWHHRLGHIGDKRIKKMGNDS